MTRPWFPNGWTEPVIGTEDQMRMAVPRDADFGYSDDLEAFEPGDYKSPDFLPTLADRADDWRDER